MLGVRSLADRLLTNALDRDGQAPALQAQGLAAGDSLARDGAVPATARRVRYAKTAADLVLEALAQKLLGSWLQNQHQTLYPLALNFRTLNTSNRLLLMQAIGTALRAGEISSDRLAYVQTWLRSVGGTPEDTDLLQRVAAAPPPLALLIEAALAARQGPFCYAVSLVALSQAALVNRLYLDYLAAKLAISGDIARSLAQRYRL